MTAAFLSLKTAQKTLKSYEKVISALEQMRFRLVKADVELRLIETTLKRTEALAEKRISAQKELSGVLSVFS